MYLPCDNSWRIRLESFISIRCCPSNNWGPQINFTVYCSRLFCTNSPSNSILGLKNNNFHATSLQQVINSGMLFESIFAFFKFFWSISFGFDQSAVNILVKCVTSAVNFQYNTNSSLDRQGETMMKKWRDLSVQVLRYARKIFVWVRKVLSVFSRKGWLNLRQKLALMKLLFWHWPMLSTKPRTHSLKASTRG